MTNDERTEDWSAGAAYVDGAIMPLREAKIPITTGAIAARMSPTTSLASISAPSSALPIISSVSALR